MANLRPTGVRTHTLGRIGIATGCCVIAAAVSGCVHDGGTSDEHASDCQNQVRVGDRVYTSYGYTDRVATSVGEADRAECQDNAADGLGSVFPKNAERVAVWAFPEFKARDVLGVRFDSDTFAVFVSDEVDPSQAERIYAELSAER